MDQTRLMQQLFDASAERYERDIVPLLMPLAADFIAYAAPRRSDIAADIGTGTGLAARLLAPYVRRVIGLDISPGSLRAGRRVPTVSNVHLIQADLHAIPVPARHCSLVVASFALNSTDPALCLRAIRRIIAPGGRLVIQEWGPTSEIDLALENALIDHNTDSPNPALAALRDQLENTPSPWRDQLQDADDYREWLTDGGFEVEDASESAPVTVRIHTAADYLRYKLAWTYRWEEVQAMSRDQRLSFMQTALTILAAAAAPDGSLAWSPVLFRSTARKL